MENGSDDWFSHGRYRYDREICRLSLDGNRCKSRVSANRNRDASHEAQYTRRRTTVARGAATTGRRTTTAARGAAATQPARYTPAAQTTALACVVPRATKPPSSNSEMIKCFMTVLLELWLSQNLHRKGNQAKSLSKWTESLRPRYLARSAPTRTALCVA